MVVGSTVQHYKIESRLGAGGMGEVYLAEDVRLGRQVALKFLPAALKADADSRARLLNEARAASLLRSPNIAVTYDIGDYSGSDFIVMEYVEGELLSALAAKGPLPIREVVEAGLQVADALEEAHGRGIIHRDIKSANLIRTSRGLVKVLDFGLAKFLPGPSGDAVTQPQMTIAGMVVGTVSYMAPEQALGRVIDHRADLFSLGVVLYELATGRPPFAGASPTEIIDRILHDTPTPPSRFDPAIPPSFDAVIAHALDKSPAFRYQTARELHGDLDDVMREVDEASAVRPRGSSGAMAHRHGVGESASRRRLTPRPGAAPAVQNAVAVMTFANITREPADDWIGTGISETVSADLKNIHGLTVIGRARVYDALRNIGSDTTLDESLAIDIGRRLGATWVLVGAFQRMAEMIRITAHVVDIASGTVRRTVKVDGRIGEIFALQDKIVYELTQGLNVVLRGPEVAGIEKQETRSVEAYQSYARGMMNLRLATRESIERAIAAFEEATRHDPEYAQAWAALGGTYSLKGSFLNLRDLMERAIELEQRALAIDPDFADAHNWLGIALLGLGRTDDAIAAIREAIRLDPENGQAHQSLARALWVGKGDFAGAIPEFEKAIELNPEAGYSYLQLGLLLAWQGQYERAIEVCLRAVELQDQFVSGNAGLQVVGANARLGYVYYLQGRYDDALREYERGLAFLGSSDHALKERTSIEINMKIGAAHHRAGRAAEAARHFDRSLKLFTALTARGADDPFTRYYIACLHALRGEADEAFDSLLRVSKRFPELTAARAVRDPDLESLRADSRFAAIARPHSGD
jgi:eukaryotic-like serine/threonine-protein kinase